MFYLAYVGNRDIPFYFPFIWSYNHSHAVNGDTNEVTLLTVQEAINAMEVWIIRGSRWAEKPLSSKDMEEHINKINIENFEKICEVFLEEGIRSIMVRGRDVMDGTTMKDCCWCK